MDNSTPNFSSGDQSTSENPPKTKKKCFPPPWESNKRREAAKKAVQTRRNQVVESISKDRPDLLPLYRELVKRLWSPANEIVLLGSDLHQELPAILWDALMPKKGQEGDAIELIVSIVWAINKKKVVRKNLVGYWDIPMILHLWFNDVKVEDHPRYYLTVFLDAICFLWYKDTMESMGKKRRRAMRTLKKISSSPHFGF